MDGATLVVVHPVINTHGRDEDGNIVELPEDISEAQAIERARGTIPAGLSVVEVDSLPATRAFRNAWELVDGAVVVNMPRARDIHKSKLRELRAPKLAALDVEYQRADEAGDAAEKARIAAQKQALRDVTSDPAIAAASTPEALAAVLPECLA